MTIRHALWLFAVVTTAAAAPARDPAMTEAELKSLQSRIQAAEAARSRTASETETVESALRNTETELARAVQDLRNTEAELAKTRDAIVELKAEKAGLEADREQQKTRLAEQLRRAYASGRQDVVKLVLNQEDPNELGRLLGYYGYLSKARSADIQALTSTLEQLARVETELFDEIHELDSLKARQESQQQSLTALQSQRQSQLLGLQKTLKSQDARIGKLKADAAELEAVLQALREELARMSQANTLKGLAGQERKLSWPLPGRIATAFGALTPQGLRSTAVQFRSKEGQDVAAIYQGRVIFADWLRGYGLVLIVDHGDGWMSLYGHAQALLKRSGDWVEPGEPVATTGVSGGQDNPGLYFEIRHQGVPVDPALYCRAR